MQGLCKIILLCALVALTLFSCARTPVQSPPEPAAQSPIPSQPQPDLPPMEQPARYEPSHPLTPQETVKAYFAQQYQSYTAMSYTDLGAIVDYTRQGMKNADIWLQTLLLRRRLIAEQGSCFVATKQLPYTVTFEEEPETDHLLRWQAGFANPLEKDESSALLHVRVTGQQDACYPPMLALNAQHTFVLFQTDGVWKIVFHYYPGSVRRFELGQQLTLPDEQQMRDALAREFTVLSTPDEHTPPTGCAVYNGVRAAAYAQTYLVTKKRGFYRIGDWMGNCQNFVSQCMWWGFSGGQPVSIAAYDNMTNRWYAGGGGGSPAWENVGRFWDDVTRHKARSSAGVHGSVFTGALQLRVGDIVQLCTGAPTEGEEEYHHSLIVVDEDTLLLAQNSPDCLVYYSDLIQTATRYFRPAYLIEK